jgi:apolipoprotein N-acyltransferase
VKINYYNISRTIHYLKWKRVDDFTTNKIIYPFLKQHPMKLPKYIPAWLLSGLLYALPCMQLQKVNVSFVAWFAFVPFLVQLKNNTRFSQFFGQSFLLFLVAFAIAFNYTFNYSWWAFVFVIVNQSLLACVPFALHFWVQKKKGYTTALCLLPFTFTIWEWCYNSLPHSVSATISAYTQAAMPLTNQLADVTGMWGISTWLMGINVAIALCIFYYKKERKKFKKVIAYSVAWLCLPMLYAAYCFTTKDVLLNDGTPVNTALVQTNINSYSKQNDSSIIKNFTQLILQTDTALAKYHPDILVHPETSIPIPLFTTPAYKNAILQAVNTWQTPLALGFMEVNKADTNTFYNQAIVITPTMAAYWDSLHIADNAKIYKKRKGFPFVESMSYGLSLPTNHSKQQPQQLATGNKPVTYTFTTQQGQQGQQVQAGIAICWETMHPSIIRDLVNDNAEMLLFMNNDGWFGNSLANHQLMNFAKLRAIETRRPIARCSNTGTSVLIDAMGCIQLMLPNFTTATGAGIVQATTYQSVYVQWGDWWVVVCGLMVLLLMFKKRKPR